MKNEKCKVKSVDGAKCRGGSLGHFSLFTFHFSLFICLAASPPAHGAPEIDVPEGYSVELVAAPPLVAHPMMAAFDDRGRLYVAESSGENLPAKELREKLP